MSAACDVVDPRRVLRFLARVMIGLDDECWPWLGPVDRKGYGTVKINARTSSKTHIYAHALFKGPVPKGLHVDHECNNPVCVNPAHLRAVTNTINNARSSSPSATNARKVACIMGHAFTIENTILDRHGHRHCRTCDVARRVARRAA